MFAKSRTTAKVSGHISGSSGHNFYKSAAPLVLHAKAHPEQLSRDNKFILRRPTDSNDPDYYGHGIQVLTYGTEHFLIHYTEDNSHGDAVYGSDGDPSTIPQYIIDTGTYFENSYAHIRALGFPDLPGDGGLGGDNRTDVYILALSDSFGYTDFDSLPSQAYIVMDSTFASVPSNLDPGGTQLGAIKVTSAHELFHCFQLQYSDDVADNGWWMESSATWMEDEVYPGVKDYLNYVGRKYDDTNDNGRWDQGETYYKIDGTTPDGTCCRETRWFDLPDTSLDSYDDPNLFEYGNVIWVKYLSENLGKSVIKDIWTRIGNNETAINAISNGVIPSASFASRLQDFRTKVRQLEFTDGPYYPLVKHEGTYTSFPQAISGQLDHLSSRYYAFKSDNTTSALNLTFSGMNSGNTAVRLLLYKNQGYDVRDMILDNASVTSRVNGFGLSSSYSKVVAIITNTSTTADAALYSVTADKTSYMPGSSSTEPLTSSMNVTVTSSQGAVIVNINNADPVAAPPPSGFVYAIDNKKMMTSITGVDDKPVGITFTFSSPLPDGVVPYKYINGTFTSIGSSLSSDRKTILLSITDGGAFDADGSVNGTISDPVVFLTAATAPASGSSGGGGGGCFIATAAYGSYLAPEVMVLRKFRDKYLLTNTAGRYIVDLYYKLSPPLASVIAGNEYLRVAARTALTPIVFGVNHPAASLPIIVILPSVIIAGVIRRRKRKMNRHENPEVS